MVANTNTEALCNGLVPFYEVTGLTITMLVLHSATLIILISHTWTLATKACLDHPVFAVIFQEMVVLCTCEFVDISILVAATILRSEMVVAAYLNVARMAMLFHPVTWAIISILR